MDVPLDDINFPDTITNLIRASAAGADVSSTLADVLVVAAPIIDITMEYGLCSEATVADKKHSKNSELREAILEHTSTSNASAKSAARIQKADAKDIARLLMKVATSGSDTATLGDRPPLSFEQFAKSNSTTAFIELQPAASELLQVVSTGDAFRVEASHCELVTRRSVSCVE